MRHAWLVLILLVVWPCAAADPDLAGVEKTWAAAVVARDFSALDKMLGAQLIYARATGAIESKQQYLARLRGGAQKYESITRESMRVAPYGDSVVTHSIAWMKGVSNGNPFNDHVMMLHVWVKQRGAWQLVAHQTTKLQ